MERETMASDENRNSFEEVYISYFSKMKHFAREYVVSDEDAENIVQDVFLELWERKELLNMPINLIAYLFTAIKNRCIDLLRRKVMIRETADKLQEEHLLTLRMKYYSLEAFDQNLFQEKDIEQILSEAINNLPEKCREIFVKSKIEGKKQKEIAAELNVSINTIETQMGIAYKKLKTELKDYLPLFIFLINL
ncbi:RNA polymerase sigma-70 factor [Bacteroides sp. 51]|uniref:RNA polymerase sigma-70 factor n=1 Tax=Bacteroides sp. 51 TaxID=2302938 RepID=UPI001EF2E237|nr:RNA polymerase sigma-70 factor [Bacteroides sp. 51]